MRSTLVILLGMGCVVAAATGTAGCNSSKSRGTPGVSLMGTAGLQTTESGGQASFQVVLDAKPRSDVRIALSSSDVGEGTVSPSAVLFTALNWDAPQTVTIRGEDDPLADGTQVYSILLAVPDTTDTGYSVLPSQSVSIQNIDDETAGLTVNPTSGLTTNEPGTDDATFTVALNSQPSADVTVPVTALDEGEIRLSVSALTFTMANWNSPQTVTVLGVDDSLADGPQTAMVSVGPTSSTDASYVGVTGESVAVVNADDDSAGVTVTTDAPVVTTEGSSSDTFTVVLNSEPTDDVVIGVSSDTVSEGTVSPAMLTFTAANWDAPQVVTITGVDDDLADGNQVYTVLLAAATSNDTGYSGIDPDDVAVSNTDDDSAGVTVDTSLSQPTSEAGGQTTFTVVLNSEPAASVSMGLSSSDTGEATVAPGTLTFTITNWASPQVVTVTGVNDNLADGDQVFRILTAAATSGDGNYDGLDAADVTLTNTDDDTAGVTVNPINPPLTTTESGGTAQFSVVLNTQPTADVSIDLDSTQTDEGVPQTSTLVFTPVNWDAPQTVTVVGQDDAAADGNQVYSVRTRPALSTDSSYATLDAADVSITNTDNDSAGITVTPLAGLVTTEAGGTASFTVVLNSQPSADVVVPVSSSNAAEGALAVAALTFTGSNWNAPQTVVVTGEDDSVADGNRPYTVLVSAATSTDSGYDGFDAMDVSLTNTDNDSAGITVTPFAGLVTTEAGGTDTFTVVLNSQPTANVQLALSSDNTSEGTVDAPTTLTFTPVNWNAPQTVTVRGVGDTVFDGDQVYNVVTDAAVSSDPSYDGIDPRDVSVTNDDNDPGVSVTPTSVGVTESGNTATFDVVLNTAPSANVRVGVASSDTSEATIGTTELTFTPVNFGSPQTVTVTGVDDALADGDQVLSIVLANTVSTDTSYNNLPVNDVAVTNVDDDTAGITVTPRQGLVTSEDGSQSASFTVVLNAEPTANVTIAVTSLDTSEVTVDTASLTFTTLNWAAPQTVNLTGVDDAVADGNQPFTIELGAAASADTGYDGLDPSDPRGSNTDNETAGFTVTPVTALVTREDGTAAPAFQVRLNSQPTADVTVDVSSADASEGLVAPASLTFTAANWDAFQSVVVTGVDDAVADGDQPYTVVTAPATSSDPVYSGLNPNDVSVVNVDDDSAGVTIGGAVGLTTTEAGATDTFTIVLNSEPTNLVTIPLVSADLSEVSVSPSMVQFSAVNWNAPQTVTVTGVDDNVQDGSQVVAVRTQSASSADASYQGIDPADVTVTNTDDETAGFTVTPTTGLSTTEAGGFDTYTVELDSEPTASVTVSVMVSDATEASVAPASLTFTPANWNAPQTVTVTGENDFVADGDQSVTVMHGVANSADPNYDGLRPADVLVSNVDDETAGVTVSPTTGLTTSEDGTVTDSFTVVLNSQPLGDVSLSLSSSDVGEGNVGTAMLTFTPTNWDSPQTVTVTGVDDVIADGNQVWLVTTTNASSTADPAYDGLPVADVTVSNLDDETAGVLTNRSGGLLTNESGGQDSFTVRLASQPLFDVTVPVASDDAGEGTVAPASLTFTAGNWNVAQTVTVTGANDAVADGNQPYAIDLGPLTSADGTYNGLSGPSVGAINLDDETAGISVAPTTGLVTNEAGATDSFDVVLNSQPTADVVIGLSGNPTAEGLLSTSLLTFTAADWNMPQTVTITGVDDAIQDGNRLYFLIGDPSASLDPDYANLSSFTVEVTNADDD